MPVEMTEFWDDNYYGNPSLKSDMVESAEKKLGVTLPRKFVEILNVQNGGYTKGFAFPMSEPTSWHEKHVPLHEMFGIVLDNGLQSGHNILNSQYLSEEWGLPDKQVVITGDGHWWITLDYRNGESPAVRWIDTECEEDIHIADSFEEFLNGLVSEDEFAE